MRPAGAMRNASSLPGSGPPPAISTPSSWPRGPRWPARCSIFTKRSRGVSGMACQDYLVRRIIGDDAAGEARLALTRRHLLGRAAGGIGAMALASLMQDELQAAPAPGARNTQHAVRNSRPRIRRVIHLYMAGGPSHLDTVAPMEWLAAMHGQPMPQRFTQGQQIAQLQGQQLRCYGPQHPFRRYGKAGLEFSELFPHLGRVADELCILRSMHTEQINHD